MAIVANAAGHGVIDKPLNTFNRESADNPNGVLTPQFAGEIVLDMTNDSLWQAKSLENDNWVLLTPTVV